MRVAMDEQIFAIQAYGGISRVFAELASQFTRGDFGVELAPFSAPIVNRYILEDESVKQHLQAKQAHNEWTALARYASRLHTHPQAEVVHNTFYLPHGLAPTRGAKRIVTVHDMIPELLPHTRRRLDLLTMKRRYVVAADHIICVSQAAKSDLLSVYPEVSAPITVVHHGVRPQFAPGAAPLPDLPEQYILMVGNRDQYKDAAVLFRAFALIADDYPNVHLICIGGGSFTKEERGLLAREHIANRVRQDVLSDQRMPGAYGNALAFVFPSRYEGFGLPVLEAMACGAPTVLAQATSLPEVGGDAARYFSVGDAQALAARLAEILARPDEAAQLAERGIERAGQFTWDRAARETAQVYQSTLAS